MPLRPLYEGYICIENVQFFSFAGHLPTPHHSNPSSYRRSTDIPTTNVKNDTRSGGSPCKGLKWKYFRFKGPQTETFKSIQAKRWSYY